MFVVALYCDVTLFYIVIVHHTSHCITKKHRSNNNQWLQSSSHTNALSATALNYTYNIASSDIFASVICIAVHYVHRLVQTQHGHCGKTKRMEHYYLTLIEHVMCFFCLKKRSPFTSIVLDLAATLFTPEKCFVDSTLHPPPPPPPSASGWVDNKYIFIFGWTIPL